MFEEETDRVFVAIAASSLESTSRGDFFLRNEIARRLGEADLFGVSSPVRTESKFFGRATVAEELSNRLFARHENAGVFGLRKTGKTSLMRAVERRAQNYNSIAVYLDCENPGVYQSRWWTALGIIVDRCAEALSLRGWASRAKSYEREDASLRFHADMRALVSLPERPAHVGILLDEIEYITPRVCGARALHWDEDFVLMWQTIRALQQESPEVLSFCVAGVNPACVDQTHFDTIPNPLFQLAVPLHLEPLSVSAVRSMVRTVGRYSGLKFEESVFPYLCERFGGHAFLIRLACSEVWRTLRGFPSDGPVSVSVQEFHSCSAAIRSRLSQPVKDILLSLVWWYPDEYDVLRVLAEGDRDFFREYVESESESLVQFAKYGLVDLSTGEFRIPELRDFLIEAGAEYRKEISPFRRSEIPPNLLPTLPDPETLGRIFKRKLALEVWLRRVVVAFIGVRCGFNPHKMATSMLKGVKKSATRQGDSSSLFVGRSPQEVVNELYTSELMSIVVENWDDFSAVFESKPKFVEMMNVVNLARRKDSHSKPVEEGELFEFMAAFDWIGEKLHRIPSEFLGADRLPSV